MDRHVLSIKIFGVVIAAVAGVLYGGPAIAQSQTDLSISPLRAQTTISPGFTKTGELQIRNSGKESQSISLSAESFNVTNEQYDYLFTSNTEESRWVNYDATDFSLKPGEEKIVQYSIAVPLGSEPRGYYIALLATHHTDTSTGGVTTSAQVASLLYISVDGDHKKSGALVMLNSPTILFGEASWSALLQNDGTVHYRSNYSAAISDIFGRTISSMDDTRLILPSSIRLIEGILAAPEILGVYKVTYSIGLGDSPGKQESRWLLYAPPTQILLLTLIVIALSIMLKKRRR